VGSDQDGSAGGSASRARGEMVAGSGRHKTWIFHLRHGVKFHDGTDFNADAVIWNLDRYFNSNSPQFEPPSSAMSRARVPVMGSYKKIDDETVAITTTQPASYFPYMAVYLLFTSPASFAKAGGDWAKVATLPAAGTGPFRITQIVPRQEADLVRWDDYWGRGEEGESRQGRIDADSGSELAAGPLCVRGRSTGSKCRRPTASPR